MVASLGATLSLGPLADREILKLVVSRQAAFGAHFAPCEWREMLVGCHSSIQIFMQMAFKYDTAW
jgi:hypothetical protein